MSADASMLTLTPGTRVPGVGVSTEPTQPTLFPTPRPMWRAASRPGLPSRPITAADQGVERGARDDYWRWMEHVTPAAACTRPVQLRGEIHEVSERTGAILTTRTTDAMPDGVIYKACGNRRATVCPACAEVYRADTYQLILAGINGGKGIPDTVQLHPCVFPTFTAPSFGPVHSTRAKRSTTPGQTPVHRICRPGRKPKLCPHGVDLRCHQTHAADERILGTPLCLDCYDYTGQVVWNVMSGELWRRTMDNARSLLDGWAKKHGTGLRLSYGKVAEMQARGVAHFHALVRLDGKDPDDPATLLAPHLTADHRLLRYAITKAAISTRFRTPPHPDQPEGWLIQWGHQLDIREVRLNVDGEITESAVAGYLAKYATKSTEDTGHTSSRITADTIEMYTSDPASHTGRIIDACWRLGRHGCDDLNPNPEANSGRLSYTRLRRWAHMLGFGGHFSTKSRAYSTTLKKLREARLIWRREHHRTTEHTDVETTLIVGTFSFAQSGWRNTGDAMLANTAAALARERRLVGKEEAASLDAYVSEHVSVHEFAS